MSANAANVARHDPAGCAAPGNWLRVRPVAVVALLAAGAGLELALGPLRGVARRPARRLGSRRCARQRWRSSLSRALLVGSLFFAYPLLPV